MRGKSGIIRIGHREKSCLTAGILLLFLVGCAEKGPVLLDIAYQAPAEKSRTISKVAIAVSPLKDGRGKPASVVGKKTVSSGLENELVVQGTAAEAATAGLKDALRARGILVKDVSGWDLTAEGMPSDGSAILLSGEIREFWLDSVSVPFKTSLKASVEIKIVAGDTAAKNIIRTINISSKLDQDVLYSRELLGNMLSEALSSAIDQIFKDEELKKKM